MSEPLRCPNCDDPLEGEAKDFESGDQINCPSCDEELEFNANDESFHEVWGDEDDEDDDY